MNIQTIKLTEMHAADYNPRVDLKETDQEYQNIKNSIDEFGYVEPIIWNKRTGNIVGGHQRYKILKASGIEEAEVVVVDFDDTKERACNLALNKAVGLWDDIKVDELLTELAAVNIDMSQYGFDTSNIDLGSGVDPEENAANKYTPKIQTPIYEIKGEKPTLDEMFDTTKTDSLIASIDKADLPEDVKTFLRAAAYRHTEFNYSKIAEFYAQADKDLQELMEQSALVIVDYDKAIEYGFVKMTANLEKYMEEEYGDE